MKKHLFVLSALCLTLSIVSCGKKNNSSQDSNSSLVNSSLTDTSISSGENNTSSTSSVASTFNPDDSLVGKVDLSTGGFQHKTAKRYYLQEAVHLLKNKDQEVD